MELHVIYSLWRLHCFWTNFKRFILPIILSCTSRNHIMECCTKCFLDLGCCKRHARKTKNCSDCWSRLLLNNRICSYAFPWQLILHRSSILALHRIISWSYTSSITFSSNSDRSWSQHTGYFICTCYNFRLKLNLPCWPNAPTNNLISTDIWYCWSFLFNSLDHVVDSSKFRWWWFLCRLSQECVQHRGYQHW